MSNLQRSSGSIQLDGGNLGLLAFRWLEDRYQHTWSLADSTVQIHSLESASEEHWPISPPLQQIHSQSFGDGREVVFGVGMAGRGHWSASFTLVPELKCWIVELACRSAVEPERLLSSYEIMHASTGLLESGLQGSGQQPIVVDAEHGISLEAIAPGTVAEVDPPKNPDGGQIRFLPSLLRCSGSTLQWAFRLRVAS